MPNHNGMYLINIACTNKTVSKGMRSLIAGVLAKLGLTEVSSSISNGSLVGVRSMHVVLAQVCSLVFLIIHSLDR